MGSKSVRRALMARFARTKVSRLENTPRGWIAKKKVDQRVIVTFLQEIKEECDTTRLTLYTALLRDQRVLFNLFQEVQQWRWPGSTHIPREAEFWDSCGRKRSKFLPLHSGDDKDEGDDAGHTLKKETIWEFPPNQGMWKSPYKICSILFDRMEAALDALHNTTWRHVNDQHVLFLEQSC